MSKVNTEDWGKELSNLYQVLFDASDTCGCEFCRDHKFFITVEDMKKIRDFISQTRNDLLREIMEEMPKKNEITRANFSYDLQEWNNALDQVNTILERKLSTVKK